MLTSVEEVKHLGNIGRQSIVLTVLGNESMSLVALEWHFLTLYRAISEDCAVAIISASKTSIGLQIARSLGIPIIDDIDGLNLCEILRQHMQLSRRGRPIHREFNSEAQLSVRESAILVALRAGLNIKEIAGNLSISPNTVSTYKNRIMAKLHANSNADLINGDRRKEHDT